MSAPVWGVATAAFVASLAWRHRPAPTRARVLSAPGGGGDRGPRSRGAALDRALTALGALVLRAVARPPTRSVVGPPTGSAVRPPTGSAVRPPTRSAVRPPTSSVVGPPTPPAVARRLGGALAAAAPVALVLPPAAPAVGLAVWLAPAVRDRRRQVAAQAEVRAAVPEVVDLFSLAVGAGLTVPLALEAVAGRVGGPVGVALRRAAGQIAVGARVADTIESLPVVLGEPVRPLTAALVASDRYGVPLASSLDRLAAELRADRRRWAEERARRVPVKLLFPLVLCILPAFALLTVVPLAASALGSLRL